jgi:hypothetical protein
MSPGQHQVYADLVGGLLDAREDPAVVRFDAELAAAVTRGEVSPEAAKRLRAWQRASVRGVADHVRAVLPTVLAALEGARADALAQVVDLAAAFDDASTSSDPAGDVPGAPGPGWAAEVTPSPAIPSPAIPSPAIPSPAIPSPAIPAQTAPADADHGGDTPEPASSPLRGGASSLGAAQSRLMVADLVPSRSPVVHDPR